MSEYNSMSCQGRLGSCNNTAKYVVKWYNEFNGTHVNKYCEEHKHAVVWNISVDPTDRVISHRKII